METFDRSKVSVVNNYHVMHGYRISKLICLSTYLISNSIYVHMAVILLAHDPLSSLAYSMITHTPPVASKLPIKTLVARQQPTTNNIHQVILQLAACTYIANWEYQLSMSNY